MLHLLDVFPLGDVLDRGNKAEVADGVFDLALQGVGQGVKALGGNGGEVALAEFSFHRGEFFRKYRGTRLTMTEQAIFQIVHLNGGLILEFEAELTTPLNERAFGDAEFRGNADKAPALSPPFHKLLPYFRCVHKQYK